MSAAEHVDYTQTGPRISLYLSDRLRDFAYDLLDEDNQEGHDELMQTIRALTVGMCSDCGTYEPGCPCNDRADWIATGGY